MKKIITNRGISTLILGIFILLLAAVLGIFHFLSKESKSLKDSASTYARASKVFDKLQSNIRGSTRQRQNDRVSKSLEARKIALSILISKWKTITWSRDGLPESNISPLVEESANELLCSNEMLSLLEYLNSNGGQLASRSISERIISMLEGPNSQKYRESLSQDRGIENRYLKKWIYYGGRFCPKSEYISFAERFGENIDIQRARLIREITENIDPQSAFKQLMDSIPVDYFQSDDPIVARESIAYPAIQDAIENFPIDIDFSNIISDFPPNRKHADHPINANRESILSKWAQSDFAAAAEYILSNSEQIDMDSLRPLSRSIEMNPETAIAYSWSLPAGPQFDAVAELVARGCLQSNRESAIELTSKIGDVNARRLTQEMIITGSRGK